MALLPSPAAVIELSRYAIGQVVETAAAVATVPVRILGVLGQTELLVNRMTVLAERAETLIDRVDATIDGIDETLRETRVVMGAAALAVEDAGAVAARASRLVDDAATTAEQATAAVTGVSVIVAEASSLTAAAAGVVREVETTSIETRELLDAYGPTLRQAAPLAARFVQELTPEEVTAAIRLFDELPRLRRHLTEDVMPLLGKLDQVGPDLHSLLEVTNDLHLAIVGLPGLRMLRRRGEERVAGEDAANGR
jgi:hypothetical protein